MKSLTTRREILQFISDCGYIRTQELSCEFGYTPDYARIKVHRLYKAGLISNKSYYGKWNFTSRSQKTGILNTERVPKALKKIATIKMISDDNLDNT